MRTHSPVSLHARSEPLSGAMPQQRVKLKYCLNVRLTYILLRLLFCIKVFIMKDRLPILIPGTARRQYIFSITVAVLITATSSPGAASAAVISAASPDAPATSETRMINMQIDHQSFTLIPAENAASRALINKLPLSVEMHELNGNEKYVDLAFSLPVGPVVTGTIHAGDVMLYGNNTLVLFYKSFHTAYRYTRIGRIDAPEALENHDSMKAATISVTLSPQ